MDELTAKRGRNGARPISGRDKLKNAEVRIQQLETSMKGIEARARTAVQAEDAEVLTSIWREKKGVAEELAAARQLREQLRLELQKTVVSGLSTAVDEGQSAIARLRSDYQQALGEAEVLLRDMGALFGRLGQAIHLFENEHQRWLHQVTALIGDSPPVATEFSGVRVTAQVAGDGRHKEMPTSRRWIVYDCDLGKTVETYDELRKLLLRWYPRLGSEHECIEYFLTQPEAASMPPRLRQELASMGYAAPTVELAGLPEM